MPRLTYADMAHLTQGQEFRRLNHEEFDPHCSGSSNSAILEMNNDGIRYHCWRCGRGRLFPHPGSARARLQGSARPEVVSEADEYPWKYEWPGGSTDLLSWPQDVRDWSLEVLDVQSVRDSGMAWDAERERLWIPVHLDGVPVKWNGRKFKTDGPKYLSGKVPGYKYHDQIGSDRSVILTEDIVGARRLATTLQTSAYPILGVSLDHQAAVRLSEASEHVVIWLDNDNALVMRARRKLAKLFSSLDRQVTVYRGVYDPKREPRLSTSAGLVELTDELRL